MKRLLLIAATVLAFSFAAYAQDSTQSGTTSGSSDTQTTTTKKHHKKHADKAKRDASLATNNDTNTNEKTSTAKDSTAKNSEIKSKKRKRTVTDDRPAHPQNPDTGSSSTTPPPQL